jgi:subtilisin family serine protease
MAISTRNRNRRGLVALLVGALIGGSVLAAPAAAADPVDPESLTGTGLPISSTESVTKSATSRLAKSDPEVLAATSPERVPLLVKLDYDSVATYTGGEAGLQPTSPAATNSKLNENTDAVRAYESFAASVEDNFVAGLSAAIPDATVGRKLRTVYGGVAVTVPADQAKNLVGLPGVLAVQADELNQPLTDASGKFIGAPTLYNALGSPTLAGKDSIVGVLDTGAWPEHPSFADQGVGPVPAKTDGTARACDFGDNPLTPAADVFQCNNKLISGETFLDTYKAVVPTPPLYDSARDSGGHGTHTASTAAGSPVAKAPVFGIDRGPIKGIAPGAHLAVYKVCDVQGCYSSDTAAAVEQAIVDGVDVINYSISGGANPFTDATELAFLDAYSAGVFVAASAGNSGPGAATTDHHGGWVTTVAASTQQRAFESTLTVVGGSDTFTTKGASITAGVPAGTPVVQAAGAPYGNPLCQTPAPAGIFAGKIVVCQRGGNGRVEKGFNVKQGGAVGMILYNATLADVETDNHFLPTIHLADGRQFLDFLAAHPTVLAGFTQGQKTSGKGDVMAAFSSRGPGGAWLKPDVTAPGVEILAGNTPTPDEVASGPPGEYFQAIAGTSMSSPHVAGAAALLVSLHPDWTPGQIKSALMTTAKTTVVKEDLKTPANPYDFGAGRIDLTKAGDPGLTFDVPGAAFGQAGDDPRADVDINLPSVNVQKLPGAISTYRTAKNVTNQRLIYRVTTSTEKGAKINVTPALFTLRPNESIKLNIKIDAAAIDVADTPHFGRIVLDEIGGKRDLHLPVAFVRSQGSVSLDTGCTPDQVALSSRSESTCTVTAANASTETTTVNLTSKVSGQLRITSVTGAANDGRGGVVLTNAALAGAKEGAPAIAPDPQAFGYLPLDAFGIAPEPIGDEQIINVNVPEFSYAGRTYKSVGITSNGYLVAGGGNSSDIDFEPQTLPDPARPNNVLAPFWTDLDGTGAPGVSFGILTDGISNWLVVQWQVYAYGTEVREDFQTWIGLNGAEDITFGYNSENPPTEPANQALTVGAENIDGSAGAQIVGVPTGSLRVTSAPSAPGGTVSYTFTVAGVRVGAGSQTTSMTSPSVLGTTIESDQITVIRK